MNGSCAWHRDLEGDRRTRPAREIHVAQPFSYPAFTPLDRLTPFSCPESFLLSGLFVERLVLCSLGAPGTGRLYSGSWRISDAPMIQFWPLAVLCVVILALRAGPKKLERSMYAILLGAPRITEALSGGRRGEAYIRNTVPDISRFNWSTSASTMMRTRSLNVVFGFHSNCF